jgi:DNA-binding GntR family transcriptional regulator
MATRTAKATSGSGRTARSAASDERIYQDVAQAIVDHSLPPGTKLTEDALAEIFGVSRTVIRSALLRLAHDGLVDLQPNRGAFVAKPSVKEARDVFAARRIVEGGIVAQAASHVTDADVQELRRAVEAEIAARDRGDRKALITLSGEFHLRLADIAGNEILADVLRELVSRSSLVIAVYQAPGRPGCRCDDHQRLVDRLAAGDAAGAARLLETHLADIEGALDLEEEAGGVDLRAVFASVHRGPRLIADPGRRPGTLPANAAAAPLRRKE